MVAVVAVITTADAIVVIVAIVAVAVEDGLHKKNSSEKQNYK